MKRRGFLQALSALVGALMLPQIPAVPARAAVAPWAPVGDPKVFHYTIGPGGDYSTWDAFHSDQAARDLVAENAHLDVELLPGKVNGGTIHVEGWTTGPRNSLTLHGSYPRHYWVLSRGEGGSLHVSQGPPLPISRREWLKR